VGSSRFLLGKEEKSTHYQSARKTAIIYAHEFEIISSFGHSLELEEVQRSRAGNISR
jgi:hypothetical protein